MTSEPILRLRQLHVRYGTFTAVRALDLDIPPGELFGLLGPNGAGKSTTVRILIGQRRPTSGQVSVLGMDLQRDWNTIKAHFGYVPDRDNHFDEFTGRQNLDFFAGLYGVPKSRVRECLEIVELAESADVPVRGYSMGMKKKLLLARAVLHKPKLLYLDEPTANLDIHSTEVVHRLLREHVKTGGSVLLTTHNMPEVEAICDRVGILCKGELVALDSPLHLRQRHTERKVDVVTHDGRKLAFDMLDDVSRVDLAQLTAAGQVSAIHSREFDFHSTFLKLTGTEFN